MTTQAIRDLLATRPFRRFKIRTVSGMEYPVTHPEALSISPGGRTVHVWTSKEGGATLDLLLVEAVTQDDDRQTRRRSA
jgi:hypothetical protein